MPLLQVARRCAPARLAAARALSTQALAPAASTTSAARSDCATQFTDEAEAQQLMGLLATLDARENAPVYAGVKWQQDVFGVWTMVPWSDVVPFDSEVTAPGRVTRNGTAYRWHQHSAQPGDSPYAAPRGVWVAEK